MLTVNVPPTITTQPKSDTVTAGQNDTFSVAATGTAPLSYVWYKNGKAILLATSSSYILTNVQATDSGTYTVTVSNVTLLNATSNSAVLTVNPAPVAPSISAQPQPQTVTAGQSATFSVTASGTPTPSYQWFKNDTAIALATSSSYPLTNVKANDAGTYKVTVINGILPNDTSSGAVLTVNSITIQPQSDTVTVGDSVTFTATITGTPPVSYQWNKDGTPIPGATSSSYSITSVQTTDAGTYFVTESNGTSPDPQSSGAVLTVTTP